MDNRGSSVLALVRGCKDSSGLGEFALACCAMLILFCAVAAAQTATGNSGGACLRPERSVCGGLHGKSARPREWLDANGAIQW